MKGIKKIAITPYEQEHCVSKLIKAKWHIYLQHYCVTKITSNSHHRNLLYYTSAMQPFLVLYSYEFSFSIHSLNFYFQKVSIINLISLLYTILKITTYSWSSTSVSTLQQPSHKRCLLLTLWYSYAQTAAEVK